MNHIKRHELLLDLEDTFQMPFLNRHDTSGYQLYNKPEPIDWQDVAMTALCILVFSWWAFDYVEMMAK